MSSDLTIASLEGFACFQRDEDLEDRGGSMSDYASRTKKMLEQAKDFRTAYDRGDFARADDITQEVLADETVPTWLWDSAIRSVKKCGIYNAYYITANCPYCCPDLAREEAQNQP